MREPTPQLTSPVKKPAPRIHLELDEFKGKGSATMLLATDRLKDLKKVATIESGSA